MDNRVRSIGARVVATVMLAASAALLLPGGEASAHAELVETTPGNGAHLDRPPGEVMLRFSEAVSTVRDGVRLLDGNGKLVAELSPQAEQGGQADAARVRLPLPDSLGDSVYIVDWRVLSADSHPVHGAFVFSVGSANAAPLGDSGARAGADRAVEVAFWLVRLLGFVSLALLVGGAFFVTVCWPAGRADPRVRRLLGLILIASVALAGATFLLQGANIAGSSLVSTLDPTLVLDTLTTSYGVLLLARIALLGLAGVMLIWLSRQVGSLPSRGLLVFIAVLGFALVLTWSGAGHPAAGRWPVLAILTDGVHLLAMSVWLGGLAVLSTTMLGGSVRREPDGAVTAVSRFSRAAGIAVVLLGGTGLVQAWRELSAAGVGTQYFSLLAFKIGAFGLLLWLGAVSRSVVRRRLLAQVDAPAVPNVLKSSKADKTVKADKANKASKAANVSAKVSNTLSKKVSKKVVPDRKVTTDTLSVLRRSVRWEAAIAAVVLALTAALVATPPGGHDHGPTAAAATAGPFLEALALPGSGDVQVWVAPARPGNNEIVLNVRDGEGVNKDVPEVQAQLRLPDGNVGPLTVSLAKTGPGQFVADSVLVPVAGRWRLDVRVRTTDFEETSIEAEIPVRS